MKRLHVHRQDLSENIAFYSAPLDQQPSRTESEHAKWMLTATAPQPARKTSACG